MDIGFDIIFFVIIPLIVLVIITKALIEKNNSIATSSRLEDKILRVCMQPRIVRDSNHKDFEMDTLMVPVREKNFSNDSAMLFKQSIEFFSDGR